uniref:Ubiquitin-like protein 7 n=1 Tax=Sinocyclocheilus rhinocerous TaxID=307959 RepID=A0A673HLC8_9TELE
MESSAWHLSLKLSDKPKEVFQFPDTEPGDVRPGGYQVSTLKQLISAQLSDALPDPELIDFVHCGCVLKDDLTLDSYGIKSGSTLHIIKKTWPEPEVEPEPVNRSAAAREFRTLQAALLSSGTYRDAVFKMLANKESLEQIIVASPGLSSDPVALGVLQDKDLFVQFTDPKLLDMLIQSHPALVNAIILVLHSVTGSSSSRNPGRWQTQMQQLRDMGIQDEEVALRALTATNGDLQAALELIFSGGGGGL